MTRDEIGDIRQNLRDALEALDELDSVETWTDTERQEAMDVLSDFGHFVERQKMYYRQYRGFLKD